MEYAGDDKEIQELLSKYRLKGPPKSLLQNYESEVMAKIQSLENVPVIPMPVIALSAALMLLLGFIWFMILRPEPVYQPTISQNRGNPEIASSRRPETGRLTDSYEVPVQMHRPSSQPLAAPRNDISLPATVGNEAISNSDSKEASEEKAFDQMERDLFILEMLGEDEGLMDDLDRLAADVEFVIQSSPVIG